MQPEEAMIEYLTIAQELEMYGVHYAAVKYQNEPKTDIWLGISSSGLNIYDMDDRLTPKIRLPFDELRKVDFGYWFGMIVIQSTNLNIADVILSVPEKSFSKQIHAFFAGNYELHTRRRQPDTPELKQLRAQAHKHRLAQEQLRYDKV